jgi:hypothetical protein
MPLVNGKEIEIRPGQPEAIQQKIDIIPSLRPDLKSEIPVRDQKDLDFTYNQFSMFEKESAETADRKVRYAYYREMDKMEFVHRALEIVSDDSTQKNNEGNAIKIYSDDEETKKILEELFYERLDINNELWSVVYETCKMGDNFYEVIVDDYKKPKKIVYLRYLEPTKVERVEENGRLSHFVYKRYSSELETLTSAISTLKREEDIVYKLQPWQIIHFRIEDKEKLPYGCSLLDAGVGTYRKLSLLEDVMLVYRISRAPERRVFYIDVGNLNKVEARQFLERVKNQYRAASFIDENGNINKKAHVLSVTSDIFVPVREGSQGTKIETLAGGQGLESIDDMKYFRDKILRTMNIPAAYMGDEADRSRGSLAQLDIKFSRFIERIQSQMIKGLNKIAALELFFQGAKKAELNNFEIEMTPPSNIKEITEIDLINQKMGLLQTIQSLNIFGVEWMLKNIMRFSDKEISDVMLYKRLEQGENPQGAEASGGSGGVPPIGAEGGTGGTGGAPPFAGAGGPEAGGGAPGGEPGGLGAPGGAPLTAGTLINVFGKEFLVENNKDFFKLVKMVEDYNKPSKGSKTEIAKELREIFLTNIKKKMNPRTKNVIRQIITNEFGGLSLEEGSVALYETHIKGKAKPFEKRKVKEVMKNAIFTEVTCQRANGRKYLKESVK